MKAPFTEGKFCSLKPQQQHWHCALAAKEAYEALIRDCTSSTYQRLAAWLGEALPHPLTLAALSDRYHYHLQQSGRCHKEHNLLPQVTKNDRTNSEPLWPYNVYLDNLRSAHNVGSIIRTMEAMAFGTLFLSNTTPTPEQRQVQQAAMGADQWVPWQQCDCSKNLPRPLIALETVKNAISLNDFLFPLDESFTLALGNEEYGCSDTLLATADIIITIPLRGRKNSLNVANTFALVAGELLRQKQLAVEQ